MMQYIIIRGSDLGSLANNVNEFIGRETKKKWIPTGSPQLTKEYGETVYYQALYRS